MALAALFESDVPSHVLALAADHLPRADWVIEQASLMYGYNILDLSTAYPFEQPS